LLRAGALVRFDASPIAAQGRKRAAAASQSTNAAEDDAPAGYDQAIESALREFELENYAEARSGFREAHRLFPNARTFRALGMAEFELKNYPAALEYLAHALTAPDRPLSPPQRADTEELLARTRRYVGRYTLSLRPANARLLVGGNTPTLAGDGRLVLPVGAHALDAEADGHRPLRRSLQVVGGEEENLDILLHPLPVADASQERRPDAPAPLRTPVYKKWWLWTTIGIVVAAGVATGLVLGLRGADDAAPGGGNTGTVLTLPPEMSRARQ
jgi:hypothetical protein